MNNKIRFEDKYDSKWIDQIIAIHNKTEMKRNSAQKDVIDKAFSLSYAVISAWIEDRLVAVGRMISDGQMYSSIFDVVVDPEFQKMGIGKEVVSRLIAKAPSTCIHLTSTFGNESFYAKLGFKKHKTAMALYPGKLATSPYLEHDSVNRLEVIITQKTNEHNALIDMFSKEHWGDEYIVSRGRKVYPSHCKGLIAYDHTNKLQGILSYELRNMQCEIVMFEVLHKNCGVGTQLLTALFNEIKSNLDIQRVWLITTNDNLEALQFYQKRGFVITAIYKDAIKESRLLKPEIPRAGQSGIEIRDEIELEFQLCN